MIGRYAAYLHTSPIARLGHWLRGRDKESSDSHNSEESSLCPESEEAHDCNTHGGVVPAEIHDEGGSAPSLTLENSGTEKPSHSTTQEWPLGLRIWIAGVISWYT